jgi:hypothetical protein
MMAPHYERARLLGEAIDQAKYILRDPIDSIVVRGDTVEVIAGTMKLVGSYGYGSARDPNGGAIKPGSGSWWVSFGKPEAI